MLTNNMRFVKGIQQPQLKIINTVKFRIKLVNSRNLRKELQKYLNVNVRRPVLVL